MFQHEETGYILTKIWTLEELQSNAVEIFLMECPRYFVVDRLQFTGLHDKNGKEIYEGDILEGLNKKTGQVIYLKGAYCFSIDSKPLVDFGWEASTEEWAIVIGNIYENPELLEQKQ